ncbi:MAG: hypothetical protein LJU34_03820 [Oscillospiraceae bacterium]|nr:hypothetical protein [Oscillospiraceae bacterium]
MKKSRIVCILLALFLLAAVGCSQVSETTEIAVAPDSDRPGTPHALSGTIVVRGFEWGPGVNRVIFTFDEEIDGVYTEGAAITTSHFVREVTDVYLSDELGNAVSGSSCYVTVEMVTNFDATGSPFETDMSTEHSVWADEYVVEASFTVWASGSYFTIEFNDDCIDNRVCPELERFTLRDSYTGDYENPLTGQTETLTLNYAAYEPDSLASWDKNPLIIWLHGRGEGGDDIERAILGNEVSALTETEIQSYFTSGDQTGAYVLVVQCPTYWLDGGDGTESRGDVSSRYTEILMDTIEAYVHRAKHGRGHRPHLYYGGLQRRLYDPGNAYKLPGLFRRRRSVQRGVRLYVLCPRRPGAVSHLLRRIHSNQRDLPDRGQDRGSLPDPHLVYSGHNGHPGSRQRVHHPHLSGPAPGWGGQLLVQYVF